MLMDRLPGKAGESGGSQPRSPGLRYALVNFLYVGRFPKIMSKCLESACEEHCWIQWLYHRCDQEEVLQGQGRGRSASVEEFA